MYNPDRDPGFITVFGSANIDIGGMPHYELIERDSNPGQIRISPGGVGRNIAHNLCLLGNKVKLVSALGKDAFADRLRQNFNEAGIDAGESLVSDQDPTSVYLYITEEDGNTRLAVNDMDIYRHMTPEFISGKDYLLKNSSFVVVDANLPQNTIEYICRQSGSPVIAECVSRAKAPKLNKSLPYIHTLVGNSMEAEILTGKDIDPNNTDSICAASDVLLSLGVKRVVITLSSKGVFFADKNSFRQLPAIYADMVNGNGAGDALLSGMIAGYSKKMSFEDSVRLGLGAASISIEVSDTNNPELSIESAMERAGLE